MRMVDGELSPNGEKSPNHGVCRCCTPFSVPPGLHLRKQEAKLTSRVLLMGVEILQGGYAGRLKLPNGT